MENVTAVLRDTTANKINALVPRVTAERLDFTFHGKQLSATVALLRFHPELLVTHPIESALLFSALHKE